MTCCSHCEDAGDFFNPRAARRDLRRYRRSGPSKTTRLLLDAILARRTGDEGTLLDIGGGVGAISHELLGAGFSHAVQVDASTAYLEASAQEAERRGHRERMEHHHGDFVDLAPDLPAADVVTLDRVICCYPDMKRLVSESARKARHLYGLVFPRERAAVRAGCALGNAYFRLRGSAFRTFIHPHEEVEAVMRRLGFRRASYARTFLWQVVIYVRVEMS